VAVGAVSGLFPSRTSAPTGGAGCGPFLIAMLAAFVVLMVIADALGGTWP
jgi:hypothetical protein